MLKTTFPLPVFTLACWLAAFSIFATVPSPAVGMSAKALQIVDLRAETEIPVILRLSAGILNGESHEILYANTGAKISELIWKLEDVPMIGGQFTIEPTWRLAINMGAWTKTEDSSSTMKDSDWLDPSHPDEWSHWSKSPTELKKGYMLDTNVNIIMTVEENASLSLILGFRHDTWRWNAWGGEYIYSNTGFRADSGTFANVKVITYEQWFYAPYLGLGLNFHLNRFHLHARAMGTPWAWADSEDHHHLRNLVFEGDFQNLRYISLGAEASYDLTKAFSLSISADYQEYEDTEKGDTKITETKENSQLYYNNSAGIFHESYMFSISLDYRF